MVPWQSGLEALVGQPIIHQVPDPVHSVLEQGGGGENENAQLRIDKRDDAEGGDEPGDFPGEA